MGSKIYPESRIIPKILLRVVTQNSYNISFIVMKALDHTLAFLIFAVCVLCEVRIESINDTD